MNAKTMSEVADAKNAKELEDIVSNVQLANKESNKRSYA